MNLHVLMSCAVALLIVVGSSVSAQNDCREPQLGAIRWDAWHGSDDPVGAAVANSLGTEQWTNRWPTFVTEAHGFPSFDESAPGIIDIENHLAHHAGLRYWAFVFYGLSSPMGRALNRYLSGAGDGMQFALIVEGKYLIGNEGEVVRLEICGLLGDPRYLKTEAGRRPLFVLLSRDDREKLGAEIAALTYICANVGAVASAPLLVAMSPNLNLAKVAAEQFGGPISVYAYQSGGRSAPFRELMRGMENFWEQQSRSSSHGVIPLIMTGWDPRPRIEHPVPWTSYPPEVFYDPPTASELTEHVRDGINWARRHPAGGCLALIYAWNEFDEGGWLAPTIGSGSSRLAAVRRALRQ